MAYSYIYTRQLRLISLLNSWAVIRSLHEVCEMNAQWRGHEYVSVSPVSALRLLCEFESVVLFQVKTGSCQVRVTLV